MAAGCLFRDEQGHILLVKPTYKPGWEIPGGVVEQDESPRQACRREIQEELGLDRPVGGLLVVDYNSPNPQKGESLQFIFDGGALAPAEIAAIRLPESELSEYRFFAPDDLPQMTPTLRRRVLAAWRQAEQAGAIYLEDQE
jgi:8-oxo-dGTP pyrophosphatase MutT (NUDIX family)